MTTLGTRPTPSTARRGQPLVVCAVVAAATVVGYVVFDRWWSYHVLPWLGRELSGVSLEVWQFVAVMGTATAYAVVLLVWGIGPRHRLVGAAGALATGLFVWALGEVFTKIVWRDGQIDHTSFEVYGWSFALVTPTLAALAWGLARRGGSRWLVGLLAAPVLAGLNYYLSYHSTWYEAHLWRGRSDWLVGRIVFVVPIVVACLLCWLLERRASGREPSA